MSSISRHLSTDRSNSSSSNSRRHSTVKNSILERKYERLNRLGQGTYGTVSRCRNRDTNELVAIKSLITPDEMKRKSKEGFPVVSLREIVLLSRVKHRNIVELKEVIHDGEDKVYLVFEYCEHDIATLMDVNGVSFSEGDVKCIFVQLLQAVQYLHWVGIIHRDIKPPNLLLNNKGILKLADFGLAREYSHTIPSRDQHLTPVVVTLWYRAPELLLGQKDYTTAIDIWSCGCVLLELLCGKPLLPGMSESDELGRIFGLLGTPRAIDWPDIQYLSHYEDMAKPLLFTSLRDTLDRELSCSSSPLVLYDFVINNLLTVAPKRRSDASRCLKHEYLTKARPLPTNTAWMQTWKEHRNLTQKNTHAGVTMVTRESGKFENAVGYTHKRRKFGGYFTNNNNPHHNSN